MIAVMAKYNPFAEKAGMEKILEQKPAQAVFRVAEMLSGLGFDLKLLGSRKNVSDKLQSLSSELIADLKETFVKNDYPRFRRGLTVNRRIPYGTANAYVVAVNNASMEKLGRLVKITGMLLQTKVYLFWRKQNKISVSENK